MKTPPMSRCLDANFRFVLFAALFALIAGATGAQPTTTKPYEPQMGQEGKDVIWIPTPDEVVAKMLDLTQVAPGERVVDLGSGDGKIAIAAAKRGAIAKGIEYNPDMVEHSKRKAREAGVNVELVRGDIFESDFSNADVVTMYLLPTLNERLRPTILAMKPGTRVVSNSFDMGPWTADTTTVVDGRTVHFWRVPANIEGDWQVRVGNNAGPTLRIAQSFQRFEGQAQWGERTAPLRDAVLRGPEVSFVAADASGELHRFEGLADHRGPIVGLVRPIKGGAARLFTATRQP